MTDWTEGPNSQTETQDAIGRGLIDLPCDTCGDTGVDPSRAQPSLAMPGFNAYIAAMYPCPHCTLS